MATLIRSIAELSRLAGHPSPKHPLLGLVKVEEVRAKKELIPPNVSFGFYTIGLKHKLKGYLKYGRKSYDFQEGVLVFTAPFQLVSYENLLVEESTGWYLFFEKALLNQTPLKYEIEQYKFFGYGTNEALHMSPDEEKQLRSIFQSLFEEYSKPIDSFSKSLLVSHLSMILRYAERYYQRQFITRNENEPHFLATFEAVMQHLCSLERLEEKGIPSVKEAAGHMHLSPNYLSDALRTATGLGTQKHIHHRIIELAKEQLCMDHSVSEVAYKLGFESHTYFSRLFKNVVGMTPSTFKETH